MCTRLPFGAFSKVVHWSIDNAETRALDDPVPRAQNTGRPSMVALQHGRSGKGSESVDKGEFVVEILDAAEILP
jgi:hypothetical protein